MEKPAKCLSYFCALACALTAHQGCYLVASQRQVRSNPRALVPTVMNLVASVMSLVASVISIPVELASMRAILKAIAVVARWPRACRRPRWSASRHDLEDHGFRLFFRKALELQRIERVVATARFCSA